MLTPAILTSLKCKFSYRILFKCEINAKKWVKFEHSEIWSFCTQFSIASFVVQSFVRLIIWAKCFDFCDIFITYV